MSGAVSFIPRSAGPVRQLASQGSLRPSSSPLLIRLELIKRQRKDGPSLVLFSVNHQCRFQSTSGKSESPNSKSPKQHPKRPPVPPLSTLIGQAIRQGFRNPFRGRTLRTLYRQNPIELTFALAILAGVVVILGYTVKIYFTYFNSDQFTRYPEPIAKALRRALYYSNYQPDGKRALKYYKQALELCDEHHLDPFSDDVMGIKIQLAAWLEKVGSYEGSAKVLETLLGDCKRWIDVVEKGLKDGTLPKTMLPPSTPTPQDSTATSEGQSEPQQPQETIWGKRTRILGKAIGISVKLAEIYADEHMLEQDLAHENLVWAVETTLKEMQRRSAEGLKDGEGEWMTGEQIGATLESLGHSYETKSQFHLAIPLFFRALGLSKDQCHSATLMNNIAVCFAQHPTMAPGESPVDALMGQEMSSASPAERKTAYLEAAKRWATNAKQNASVPKDDKRTAECDEACAVSLCNLGDIAKLAGNIPEARRMFEKAITLSKSLGYETGVTQAEAGLQSLANPSPSL